MRPSPGALVGADAGGREPTQAEATLGQGVAGTGASTFGTCVLCRVGRVRVLQEGVSISV